MVRKTLKIVGWILLALLLLLAIQTVRYWDTIQRVFLGGLHTHETVPPVLPAEIKRPAILVFSKTNAFRHEEAIPAANALFDAMAKEKDWGIYKTENGAVFRPDILARFDAVVFSNTSGDVFNASQQAAFRKFVENGGGWVGIHAAGDNSHQAWGWYMQDVIGTTFIGHPMNPQFQKATMRIEDRSHPAMAGLPETWNRTDEWYSFDKSPRREGVTVLATLDEATYKQEGPFGQKLAMGRDHPIIWSRCIGKGRALYSGLGHTAESYAEPEYRQVLAGAISWAMRLEGTDCGTSPAQAASASGPATAGQ